MTSLVGIYDQNAAPSTERGTIPTGYYLACIVESEMKETKQGNGKYLELKYEIIDGEHKGRNIWVRLNLCNANPKAVEIANRDFAAIRLATGLTVVRDSTQMHNIPHQIKVEYCKANAKNDSDHNEVRGYKPREGGAATANQAPFVQQQAAPAAQAQGAAPAAAPATAPWLRA